MYTIFGRKYSPGQELSNKPKTAEIGSVDHEILHLKSFTAPPEVNHLMYEFIVRNVRICTKFDSYSVLPLRSVLHDLYLVQCVLVRVLYEY